MNLRDIWMFSFQNGAKFEEFAKKRRVLKCPPPIFVYENNNWYQCIALCELVLMHCLDFLTLDLLKRYRRNTAENRALLLSLMYILLLSINYQLLVKTLYYNRLCTTRFISIDGPRRFWRDGPHARKSSKI